MTPKPSSYLLEPDYQTAPLGLDLPVVGLLCSAAERMDAILFLDISIKRLMRRSSNQALCKDAIQEQGGFYVAAAVGN